MILGDAEGTNEIVPVGTFSPAAFLRRRTIPGLGVEADGTKQVGFLFQLTDAAWSRSLMNTDATDNGARDDLPRLGGR